MEYNQMYNYNYNQYYQQYHNYYAQWGYDQNTGSYSYSYPQYGYTQSTMQVGQRDLLARRWSVSTEARHSLQNGDGHLLSSTLGSYCSYLTRKQNCFADPGMDCCLVGGILLGLEGWKGLEDTRGLLIRLSW